MQVAERRRHLGSALLGLEAGQYQHAEYACAPLFRSDGVDVEALLLLGYAAVARGETCAGRRHPRPCGTGAAGPAASLRRPGPRPAKVPRSRIAAQFQASLRLAPEDMRLCEAYADFLLDGGQAEQAVPVCRAWLQQRPGLASRAHHDGHRPQRTGRLRSRAATISARPSPWRPDQAASWANLGMVLKTVGAPEPALDAYDEAIARDPDNPRIRVNRTVALLQAGRWAEAWPDYECRLRLPGHRPCRRTACCRTCRRSIAAGAHRAGHA